MFNWAVAIARCLVARKFKKQEKQKKKKKSQHRKKEKEKELTSKKKKIEPSRDGCRKSHEAKKSREAISHRV